MLETIPEERKSVLYDNGIIINNLPPDVLKLHMNVILIQLDILKRIYEVS